MARYTAFRPKKIVKVFEKDIFKVVISVDIPNYTQIFKSHFVDKIKHTGTEKAYKKSWLIKQTYNNPKKDLILTQLSTIKLVS